MMKYLLITILLIAFTTSYRGPQQDVMGAVDGVPYDYQKHNWYSGYLPIKNGKFHYVFFQSQRDPDNDPVLLWLNGGPGCSSLIGLVYQHGPFTFKTNSTQLEMNNYSWNKIANVLYIESPGGVGFSTSASTAHNDSSVAKDNLQALLSFFQKFPTLKKNDFYMSGESYAGIYVPYLAYQIIQYNKLPSSKETIIKLKGIMVGNACTDPQECYYPDVDAGEGTSMFQYEFLYNHGYYTDDQFMQLEGSCRMGYYSDQCKKIRDILDKKFGETRTSILNIYKPCYPKLIPETGKKIRQSGRWTKLEDEMSCDDSIGIQTFFNQPFIPTKFHVDNIHFQQCSDEVANKYTMFENASLWIYPILMKQKMRVWVYSGDVDADVPITGTVIWINRLRQSTGLKIQEPWRQWWVPGLHKHEDQVGGMTWGLSNLRFVSIKGAGHMVPLDKKPQSYVMLASFLSGTSLPEKDQ